MPDRLQNRRNQRRGAAMIEFAVSWALLWAVFAGLFQFGYAFRVYNRLKTNVANAAQFAARMDYDTADPTLFTDNLKNLVVYGDLTQGTHSPVVPDLTPSKVTVAVTSVNGMPRYVTISISDYSVNAIFTSFRFDGKPRATTAYMGNIL
ncbi:MAG: pilus assembly protein [Acidobacteria bacterium]|nr:pilus assembly protein [Acidobacteriota bacterium]